jgi:hypothetical protein
MTNKEKNIEQLKDRKLELREKIGTLEEAILNIPGTVYGDQPDCPLKHSFGEGLYVREIYNPANHLIITKIHKKAHPFFLLKGKMSILTEQGVKTIEAPFYGITPAGTKRVIWTHTEIQFVTVHATNETDIEKIEEEIIAKDFDECLPDFVRNAIEGEKL